jgi:hypothetical protein
MVRFGAMTRTRPRGDAERQNGEEPCLPAAHGYLLDCAMPAFSEVVGCGRVALSLGLAQRTVALDVDRRVGEELADVVVREHYPGGKPVPRGRAST